MTRIEAEKKEERSKVVECKSEKKRKERGTLRGQPRVAFEVVFGENVVRHL